MDSLFTDMAPYGWFALTGVFSGFLSGLLGIGGAFIMVPAFLTIFRDYYQFESHFMLQLTLGTTMACMIVNAISATTAQNKKQSVEWEVLKRNWLRISLGTFLGVVLTHFFSANLIKFCFALVCLDGGFKMIFRKQGPVVATEPNHAKPVIFFFAAVCGFIGVGGANLFVPYLMKVKGISLTKAMGTASALQIPISIIGTISYLVLGLLPPVSSAIAMDGAVAQRLDSGHGIVGYVFWPAKLLVSAVGVCFNTWGVSMAHKLPVAKLKKCFGCFTLLVGMRMAYGVYSS